MRARYLTTTLPYVNADPHIGFALEIVKADVLARLYAMRGDDVFFNTGVDEHGQKVWQEAVKRGMDPQAYVDEYAARFKALKEKLNLYPCLNFIRTTDAHHTAAAQAFWKRCSANGDIYKKLYQVKYCVGCELEKTDSELVDGRCLLHPDKEPELIDEENYFFRFSKYQQPLLELYAKRSDFILPDFRMNELRLFVERGLQDFSISRIKGKMPWGIDVPDDPEHVMYVWFDALVNYVSALGWPEDTEHFEKFWGTHGQPNALQIAGKDNLRQQAAMWQAMLMSAGLPSSKQVVIQGFITSGGQKMSKSLGNVINPVDIADELGADALRYVLLRHTSPFEDSDITREAIREHYTAHLTNGLGNLVARVMKLAEEHLPRPVALTDADEKLENVFLQSIEAFRFNEAMDFVFAKVAAADVFMNTHEPYKKIKSDADTARKDIEHLVRELASIAAHLASAMPCTAAAIAEAVHANKKPENLFPRL